MELSMNVLLQEVGRLAPAELVGRGDASVPLGLPRMHGAGSPGSGEAPVVMGSAALRAIPLPDAPRNVAVACAPEDLASLSADPAWDSFDGTALIAGTGGADALLNMLQEAHASLGAWDSRMVEAIVGRRPQVEVLAIGAEVLEDPVAMVDASLALVGYAGQLPENWRDSIWKDVIERGFSPMSFYNADELRELEHMFERDTVPKAFRPTRGKGLEYLVAPIVVDGAFFGNLAQVGFSGPFSPAQIELLGHVRNRIQQMCAASVDHDGSRDDAERILRSIVRGTRVEPSVAAFHLRRRGWPVDGAFRVLVCPVPQGMEGDVASRAFLARVKSHLPAAITILEQGCTVSAVREDGTGSGIASAIAPLVKEYPQPYGLSAAFHGFLSARDYYHQAMAATGEGRRVNRTNVVEFGDVASSFLLHELLHSASLPMVCHPRVLELAQASGVEATNALEIVRTYLVFGCNAKRASEELFMHRNTLLYRISNIESRMETRFSEMDVEERSWVITSCGFLLSSGVLEPGKSEMDA